MKTIRVGIIGVSGYGGAETARLVLQHPSAVLTYVTSNTYLGQPLHCAVPGISRSPGLVCDAFEPESAASRCDLLFLAGEAGLAMKIAPALLDAGLKIIDLSADFRLSDPQQYAHWYKAEHSAPQLLAEAIYGLPELNRTRIRDSRLIANPGCYPTSAILALAPLRNAPFVDYGSIVIDSLSGVSGAGRSKFGPDTHFSEVNESVRPYGVGGTHRHTPEIEQALSRIWDRPVIVTFTPHLAPITRGILTTAYVTLTAEPPDLRTYFEEFYKDDSFVVLLDAGTFPTTKNVYATNNCHISLALDRRANRLIVVSAIDNLTKGMAGQAVQNMNIMYGLEEATGLPRSAVWP